MTDKKNTLTTDIFGFALAKSSKNKKVQNVIHTWLMLRMLDQNGEGRLPLELFKKELLKRTKLQKKSINTRIQRAIDKGYIWRFRIFGTEYLYYVSQPHMAIMIGLEAVSGWSVRLHEKDVFCNYVKFRSVCQNAYISSIGEKGTNCLARDAIKAETGISRRTQYKYEKQERIKKRFEYEEISRYSPERMQYERQKEMYVWHEEGLKLAPALVKKIKAGKGKTITRIVRQLGNTYKGTLKLSGKSRKWINIRIDKILSKKGHGKIECQWDTLATRIYHKKRFYNSKTKAKMKLKKNKDRSVLYKERYLKLWVRMDSGGII